LDEPVGRSPTVSTNPGTPSSSTPKLKRGRKLRNGNEEMRTVRLRLLPNGSQERRLRRLADATAKLWNGLNYARLIQWREGKHVDFKGTEHEYYHKYKSVLGVNAGQVINLNNWAWKSYFETLKLHRQGKLPRFNSKPSPPGFWKDKTTRQE
jgi:putative transposase